MDIGFQILVLLCIAAFFAGFIDAVVGGGGLIQTPIGLILLPYLPVATVIGSLKIPSFTGTAFAAYQYLKNIQINKKSIVIMGVLAFFASFFGSLLLTYVSNDFMKPLLLMVLFFLAIYTYKKKDFGKTTTQFVSIEKQLLWAILIAVFIGFYDGFIGPGTGSFLILAFISLLGFDFLNASAHAKIINLATNCGSICLFMFKGKIIWAIAVPMAVCNAFGAYIGSKTAIKKGNAFIRVFFLIVVVATLLRFAYDVFFRI
jgi:uncharacterized protein